MIRSQPADQDIRAGRISRKTDNRLGIKILKWRPDAVYRKASLCRPTTFQWLQEVGGQRQLKTVHHGILWGGLCPSLDFFILMIMNGSPTDQLDTDS